jgi:hypothetical protein
MQRGLTCVLLRVDTLELGAHGKHRPLANAWTVATGTSAGAANATPPAVSASAVPNPSALRPSSTAPASHPPSRPSQQRLPPPPPSPAAVASIMGSAVFNYSCTSP